MKKLLLLGHMRHGKDTLAEMLQTQFGYTFESSSVAAARIFLYDALKAKYGYKTPEECYEDRVNHRVEWHDLIVDYNKDDGARLTKEILKESSIYVGMRSDFELQCCKEQGIFDLVIGIYDPRKSLESRESFDIDFWNQCDIIIPNAGTLDDLKRRVNLLKPLL